MRRANVARNWAVGALTRDSARSVSPRRAGNVTMPGHRHLIDLLLESEPETVTVTGPCCRSGPGRGNGPGLGLGLGRCGIPASQLGSTVTTVGTPAGAWGPRTLTRSLGARRGDSLLRRRSGRRPAGGQPDARQAPVSLAETGAGRRRRLRATLTSAAARPHDVATFRGLSM